MVDYFEFFMLTGQDFSLSVFIYILGAVFITDLSILKRLEWRE